MNVVITVVLAALATIPWIDAAATAARERRAQREHAAAMATQVAQLDRWRKTLIRKDTTHAA